LNRLGVNRAVYFLTAPFHTDKPRPVKFLYMMGNGRGHNLKVIAQLAYTGLYLLGPAATADVLAAAVDQTHEYPEPMRIRQRLEHFRKLLNFIVSIVRHYSNYTKAKVVCSTRLIFFSLDMPKL